MEHKEDAKVEHKEDAKAEHKEAAPKAHPKEEEKKEEGNKADHKPVDPKPAAKKEEVKQAPVQPPKEAELPVAEEVADPTQKKRRKKKKKKQNEGDAEELTEYETEEEEVLMADTQYYSDTHVDKDLPDSSIPKKYSRYNGCFGMESYKRFNLQLIEPHVLLYSNGNIYEFYDMKDKTRKIYHGRDTDGIGSIAVHPTRKYFAVAEKGIMPNIYIYDYPDLKLYRICRGGTERAYSHVEFSKRGDKLASVGSAPDYTITVWNWKSQKVILKSKAFSQEVYRVSFSPYTDGVLVSAGMGHIKFWKMANTFTGLKLKGELGKFGKLELSDVTGYSELPDGKVLSGTEYGTMILWEGRNIKAHLVQDIEKMKPCHDGFIEIIILQGEMFITAGSDGFIKFWNFQTIDTAEFSDENMEFAIKPIREIFVAHQDGSPAHINQMLKEKDRWILGDARGKTWEINLDTEEKEEIMNYHSGPIADLGISERKNVAVTLGSDGVIKCWDFINERELFSGRYAGKGTCLDMLPYTDSNKGRILA